MIYIGVDPGKKGGFAVVGDDGSAKAFPWIDDEFIIYMRAATIARDREGHGLIAAVEKVGAMPGQGTVSMFNFGQSYGFIKGVLATLRIGYQLVPPTVWKREFGLLNTEKRESIAVAKKLLPGVSFLPTERSRVESDGMADAALLAIYASRHFKTGEAHD